MHTPHAVADVRQACVIVIVVCAKHAPASTRGTRSTCRKSVDVKYHQVIGCVHILLVRVQPPDEPEAAAAWKAGSEVNAGPPCAEQFMMPIVSPPGPGGSHTSYQIDGAPVSAVVSTIDLTNSRACSSRPRTPTLSHAVAK